MTTFYLQFGTPTAPASEDPRAFRGFPEQRVFLDDRIHKGAEVIQEIEADDWKAARVQVPG